MAVAQARHAEQSGATAVMAIPPLSIALPENELVAYYRRIFESVQLPVIVQDAIVTARLSRRSSVNI